MAQAVDRENKPTDIRSFMEQTGASFEDAVEILYGTVGANLDTRDWKAIMASPDPLAAARQATFEMYSGTEATKETGASGNYASATNPSGKAAIVAYQEPNGKTNYAITAADGSVLRGGFGSEEQAKKQAVNFGISNVVSGQFFEPQTEKIVQRASPPTTPTTPTTPTVPAQQPAGFTPTPAQPQPPITQQVTPPSYGVQPIRATPSLPTGQTGTFSVPTATGQLSAVPQTVTYRPSYSGTPGNVPETLYQAQQQQQQGEQGVRNVLYRNAQGATMYITEANGVPMTAVPEGYFRAEGNYGQPQQFTGQPATSATTKASPAGATGVLGPIIQSSLGQMFGGFAEGGMTNPQQQPSSPFTSQQKFQLLQRMGYRGPASDAQMDQFIAANPAASARFGKLSRAATKRMGMAKGGVVPKQTMIAGQPHHLAYINPQEAKMLKDAGGAGLPGPGGIPAYFSLASGAPAGSTATDPVTGTVYTSDGNKWNVTKSGGSSSGILGEINSQGAGIGQLMGYGTDPTTSQITPEFKARTDALQQTGAQQPTMAPVSMIQPEAAQFIPSDAGMTVPQAPFAEAATMQQAEQAMMPVMTPASLMQAAGVTPAVTQAMAGVAPATGQVSEQAQVQAAQQGTTSVSQLQAAQGQAHMMNNPVQREIQAGELVTGAADAAKAAQFVEQIQAAEATPTKQATVQGQLEGLMQQFEGGATPAWAAGAMRNAMATLSARGLGASSLAGQAVIQAAMESALPIAQIDAQTRASFESQNLSNRQQVAMFAAQQRAAFMQMEFDQAFQSRVQNAARIADVANMNFTAEQQVALENSRAVNTMNLANLGNRQAMIMAEAAALSNIDMANLNNRQQAAVQNAQNFLQMDMANLSNEQQTALFRAQQTAQALFTDQAAENASRQFNATSENQTKQFFASLSSQVSQFNAAQRNAIDQYNIDQVNSLRRFNSEIQQQRDLFNAQNGLVIAQANAQWRQNLTTLNTAAQNESNRQFAQVLNNMSQTTLDQIWQRQRDAMTFAFTQSENAIERATTILRTQLEIEGQAAIEAGKSQGSFFSKLIDAGISVISKKLTG